jgi:hypothetical protein
VIPAARPDRQSDRCKRGHGSKNNGERQYRTTHKSLLGFARGHFVIGASCNSESSSSARLEARPYPRSRTGNGGTRYGSLLIPHMNRADAAN